MLLFTTCYRAAILLCALFSTISAVAQSSPPFSFTTDPRDTLGRQLESEQHRMIDPALGRVPYERLAQERERILSQQKNGFSGAQFAIPNMTWQERGPSNAGGRTRAVLFDPNDATHKKVWVGSPVGGLWYTNDITDANATWMAVSDTWESTLVTCLAADPSNPQIMYAGTGDGYRYTTGGGIWKTTDGGKNWSRLSSTIPGTFYGTLSGSFGYIQRVVVNSSGHLFAATRYGVVRSTDGGANWQFVLAPSQGIGGVGPVTNNYSQDFVSDLEIGTDNILYAAFNLSRVFKANNLTGLTWTEITPVGVPASGERTELALARSTSGASQVVYAVSRVYNSASYNQDVRWFKKSLDGGVNWSAVTIPTYNSGEHFTNGSGQYALSLTVDSTNAAVIYAGGYGYGWFRSTTGGSSWSSPLLTSNNGAYTYQQGLLLHPDNAANAVLISEQGVAWTTGWGTATSSTAPVVQFRNAGYRVAEVSSAAMKPAPGGSYLLATLGVSGAATLPNPGLSTAMPPIYSSVDGNAQTFIDSDEPSIQIFNAHSSWYLYRNNTYSYLFGLNGWTSFNTSSYDSQSNTLYVAEYVNNTWSIRRTTGIGSTTAYTNFAIPNYPYYATLGANHQSFYVASANGLITRYTNLSQATPTATVVSTGAVFPQNATVSYIDVGASDNELLVTLSNYGVSSVWYTNTGGNSWVNKDPAGSGLPDVPVRVGIFNPQNRQQVLLGTDLGVWSTSDITAANPGWALSSTGMSLAKVNQLRYRPSDGRLIAATGGRGIFESNTLALPYTPSSISITGISNTTLCAGSTVAISFSATGSIATTATNYEVWVSDSTGSFTNQRRVGTGSSSPVSLTLPTGGFNALRYGTSYQFKVVAPDADVTSSASDTMVTIGNLNRVDVADRLTNIAGRANVTFISSSAGICPSDQIWLSTKASGTTGGKAPVDSYQWLLNNSPIAGATSQTFLTGQAGTYQVQVRQAACLVQSANYTLNTSANQFAYIDSDYGTLPQCDDSPAMLNVAYRGELAAIQWYRNDVAIAGATSFTYPATQSGSYRATVVSSGCSVNVRSVPLTIGRFLSARLIKQDSLLCAGALTGNVGLYAENINNSSNPIRYTINWYKDGQLTNQAQNQTYFPASQPGNYMYELRQGNCVTRSNAVVVTQGPLPIPSILIDDPRAACPGDSRTLRPNGSYQTYQWQKDGVDIPNATGYSYAAQSTGSYTTRVSRGSCAVTSVPVSLTFANAIVPQMLVEGYAERCSNIGLNASSYARIGTAQFQWFKDNSPISGATNASLSTSQTGLYSVSVTNGACTGMSKQVMIRPYTQRKPYVVVNGPLNNCQNNAPRLQPDNYWGTLQWKKDGSAIYGMTEFAFYPTQSGRYSVQTTNTCGTVESDPVEVKVGESTVATITGAALVNSGQAAQLPIAFSGPSPWSFTLSNGQAVQNTYLNPYPLTVTPAATTIYSIATIQNACGTGTSAGQAVVTVGSGQADLSLVAQVSSRTPQVGEVVSYSLLVINAGPQDAGNVQVSSQLPAGLEFVDAVTPGVSAANGVVSGTVASIPVGYTGELTYRVRITQPGTFFTAAQIAATDTPDPDSQPNSGTGDGQDDATLVDLRSIDAGGTLVVSANPNQVPLPRLQSSQPPVAPNTVELALSLTSGTLTPKLYDVVSLSLTVRNRGGATATNMVLQTVLPAGWQLTTIAGLVVTGQTVNAYVPQLAAGGKAVVVLSVQVGTPGNSQIQAQILDVAEPVSNARPGNGYQNGERDEAGLMLQVR